MKLGVAAPYAIGEPLDIGAVAQRAEALGFESVWVGEHPVLPVHVETRWRGSSDGTIPESFAHAPDPFVMLALASAATKTLKLGTAVCLVPEHNPLSLAKAVATLDRRSGGRFLFGIGAGWLQEETEIMGGDFPRRWTQTREAVAVMKELWTKDEAEYHGEYYDFPPVRYFPKPAQEPHPPVLLGGMAPNVLKRVAAWGDGWVPSVGDPESVKAARATLDDLAAKAGRDPRSIEISVLGRPDRDLIRALEGAGAVRVIIGLGGASTEATMEHLDRVAAQVLPG